MRWVVKLLALVGVVIIVSILTFLMTDFLPGDPAEVIAGSQASDKEFVDNIREELNLDDPLPQRYLTWAGNAVQGDFGRSLEENDEPIADKLRRTIPNTVQLLLLAEIFSILIAVPIGVYSGYRANGKFDKFATGMAFFLLAIPSFVMGVVLIAIFAVSTNLLKIQFDPISEVGLAASLKTSIMPVICISVGIIAVYVRLLRTDMIATLQEDFILNAPRQGAQVELHPLPARAATVVVLAAHRGRHQPRHPDRRLGDRGAALLDQRGRQPARAVDLEPRHRDRPGDRAHHLDRLRRRELHRRPRLLVPRPEDPPWLTTRHRLLGPDRPGPGDEPGSGKKRRRLGLAFWLPALWVGLILFGAVFADLLPLQNPNVPDKCAQYVVPQFNINTGEETMPVYEPGQVIDGVRVDLCTADSRANAKPSTTHWLGTDSSGRDTFARVVYGARVA